MINIRKLNNIAIFRSQNSERVTQAPTQTALSTSREDHYQLLINNNSKREILRVIGKGEMFSDEISLETAINRRNGERWPIQQELQRRRPLHH